MDEGNTCIKKIVFRESLCGDFLLFFHATPVHKAIDIIGKEHDEAQYHGQVGDIHHACQNLKNYQHNVVGRISKCIVGTAQKGQSGSQKAGGDGNGTNQQIGGIQCP